MTEHTPNRMNVKMVVLGAVIELVGMGLLVACIVNMQFDFGLFDNVWPIAIAGVLLAGFGTKLMLNQLRRVKLDPITGLPNVRDGK